MKPIKPFSRTNVSQNAYSCYSAQFQYVIQWSAVGIEISKTINLIVFKISRILFAEISNRLKSKFLRRKINFFEFFTILRIFLKGHNRLETCKLIVKFRKKIVVSFLRENHLLVSREDHFRSKEVILAQNYGTNGLQNIELLIPIIQNFRAVGLISWIQTSNHILIFAILFATIKLA